MITYIPFRQEHAEQLLGLADAYQERIVYYPARGPATEHEIRVVAHGSRDGYIFHDSSVRREDRIMLSAQQLFDRMRAAGLLESATHIDLNCCVLAQTSFPEQFSRLARAALVTAYPGQLQNPNRRGQELTVVGGDRDHRTAVVFDRGNVMQQYRNGQRLT